MISPYQIDDILQIATDVEFNKYALEAFHFQLEQNHLYGQFCKSMKIDLESINHYSKIPCLPIEFFKTHEILSGVRSYEKIFRSSGTTGEQRSEHRVHDLNWYHNSILTAFKRKFEDPGSYSFIGLLPGYLERPDSSLIYMVNHLMANSNQKINKFYLQTDKVFWDDLAYNHLNRVPTIIFGVTHSLLDIVPPVELNMGNVIIIETGGMKGKAKEITREELHSKIKQDWRVNRVSSEYGMTELLSQAYDVGDNGFEPPGWMKFIIREIHDPMEQISDHRTGAINIIDLANIYSCCFIATGDLGKLKSPNTIEILGRLDYSDVRGCNLLFS